MRGISKNLEFGYNLKTVKWKLNGAIFKRWNKDLVDWLYSPNTRSAKHVDVDTFGFEVILSWQSKNFETITSYKSYLKKDEDYGDASMA